MDSRDQNLSQLPNILGATQAALDSMSLQDGSPALSRSQVETINLSLAPFSLVSRHLGRQLLASTIWLSLLSGYLLCEMTTELRFDVQLVRKNGWFRGTVWVGRLTYLLGRWFCLVLLIGSLMLPLLPSSHCVSAHLILVISFILVFSFTHMMFVLRLFVLRHMSPLGRGISLVIAALALAVVTMAALVAARFPRNTRPMRGPFCIAEEPVQQHHLVVGFNACLIAFHVFNIFGMGLLMNEGKPWIWSLRHRNRSLAALLAQQSTIVGIIVIVVSIVPMSLSIIRSEHAYQRFGGPTQAALLTLMASWCFRDLELFPSSERPTTRSDWPKAGNAETPRGNLNNPMREDTACQEDLEHLTQRSLKASWSWRRPWPAARREKAMQNTLRTQRFEVHRTFRGPRGDRLGLRLRRGPQPTYQYAVGETSANPSISYPLKPSQATQRPGHVANPATVSSSLLRPEPRRPMPSSTERRLHHRQTTSAPGRQHRRRISANGGLDEPQTPPRDHNFYRSKSMPHKSTSSASSSGRRHRSPAKAQHVSGAMREDSFEDLTDLAFECNSPRGAKDPLTLAKAAALGRAGTAAAAMAAVNDAPAFDRNSLMLPSRGPTPLGPPPWHRRRIVSGSYRASSGQHGMGVSPLSFWESSTDGTLLSSPKTPTHRHLNGNRYGADRETSTMISCVESEPTRHETIQRPTDMPADAQADVQRIAWDARARELLLNAMQSG